MYGIDGYMGAYSGKSDGFRLMIRQSETPFAACRAIVEKYSFHHRTASAFYGSVMSLPSDGIANFVWIEGEMFFVHDKKRFERMADIFMLYATVNIRPELLTGFFINEEGA